jgi:hypothetical protein
VMVNNMLPTPYLRLDAVAVMQCHAPVTLGHYIYGLIGIYAGAHSAAGHCFRSVWRFGRREGR